MKEFLFTPQNSNLRNQNILYLKFIIIIHLYNIIATAVTISIREHFIVKLPVGSSYYYALCSMLIFQFEFSFSSHISVMLYDSYEVILYF